MYKIIKDFADIRTNKLKKKKCYNDVTFYFEIFIIFVKRVHIFVSLNEFKHIGYFQVKKD